MNLNEICYIFPNKNDNSNEKINIYGSIHNIKHIIEPIQNTNRLCYIEKEYRKKQLEWITDNSNRSNYILEITKQLNSMNIMNDICDIILEYSASYQCNNYYICNFNENNENNKYYFLESFKDIIDLEQLYKIFNDGDRNKIKDILMKTELFNKLNNCDIINFNMDKYPWSKLNKEQYIFHDNELHNLNEYVTELPKDCIINKYMSALYFGYQLFDINFNLSGYHATNILEIHSILPQRNIHTKSKINIEYLIEIMDENKITWYICVSCTKSLKNFDSITKKITQFSTIYNQNYDYYVRNDIINSGLNKDRILISNSIYHHKKYDWLQFNLHEWHDEYKCVYCNKKLEKEQIDIYLNTIG